MKKIFTLIFTLCALMCSCSTPEMEKAEAIKSEVLSLCIANIKGDLLRPQTLTVSKVSEIVCEIDDPTVIVKSREMYWIASMYTEEDIAKEYLNENVSDLEILKSNGYRFYMATVTYYAKNEFDDEIQDLKHFIVSIKLDSSGNIEDCINLPDEISSKLHNTINAFPLAENFDNQDKTFYDVVEQYGVDLNFPSRVRKTFTIPKEYRR